MSTQSVSNIDNLDLCKIVDEKLACTGISYMRFYTYRIGEKPDIDRNLVLVRLRRVVCEDSCGLCPEDIGKVGEYINKLVS